MSVKMIISRSIGVRLGISNIFSVRSYASDAKGNQKTDSEELEFDEVPIFENEIVPEDTINMIRNKSRLAPHDRNRLNDKKPYEKSIEPFHKTVRYKRRMFGRYGLKALDVPAGIAWPTKEELEDKLDYERTAYPISIQEGWKIIEERKRADREELRLREEEIDQKLKNMDLWRNELKTKLEKKIATEKAAILKKEKMMEEIRLHFGINVSPNSPKYKELVEKKMLEDKKKKKMAMKQEKAARLLDQISKFFEISETKEAKSTKGEETPKEPKTSKEAETPKEPEQKASATEDKKPESN